MAKGYVVINLYFPQITEPAVIRCFLDGNRKIHTNAYRSYFCYLYAACSAIFIPPQNISPLLLGRSYVSVPSYTYPVSCQNFKGDI